MNTLLLDTHIFLWTLDESLQLSQKTRDLIINADRVYISSISIWEIAIKKRLKKLNVDIKLVIEAIEKQDFFELSFNGKHAAKTIELPDHHRDPFDRALIAQTMIECCRLITADKTLKLYSDLVEVIS